MTVLRLVTADSPGTSGAGSFEGFERAVQELRARGLALTPTDRNETSTPTSQTWASAEGELTLKLVDDHEIGVRYVQIHAKDASQGQLAQDLIRECCKVEDLVSLVQRAQLDPENADALIRATLACAEEPNEQVIELVEHGLRNRTPSLRRMAAHAVVISAWWDLIPSLVEAYEREKPGELKAYLERCLATLGTSTSSAFIARLATREPPESSHSEILKCLECAAEELNTKHGMELAQLFDEDAGSFSFVEWTDQNRDLSVGIYDDFMAAVRYIKVQSERADLGMLATSIVAQYSPVIGRATALEEAAHSAVDPVALMRVTFSTGERFDEEVFDLICKAFVAKNVAVRSMASYAAAHLKWIPFLPQLKRVSRAETNTEVLELFSTAIEVIESSRNDCEGE